MERITQILCAAYSQDERWAEMNLRNRKEVMSAVIGRIFYGSHSPFSFLCMHENPRVWSLKVLKSISLLSVTTVAALVHNSNTPLLDCLLHSIPCFPIPASTLLQFILHLRKSPFEGNNWITSAKFLLWPRSAHTLHITLCPEPVRALPHRGHFRCSSLTWDPLI